MADEDVTIKFGASLEDLKAKLSEVINLFGGVKDGAQKELAERAVGSFGKFGDAAVKTFQTVSKEAEKIPESLRQVGIAVAGALAVIGAGVAAKKFADNNSQMVESTRDFARAMGTTTNEASVMQAALDDVGASQGEYLGAAKGLSRQLRTNEDDLKRLGLATRDSAGNFRPLADLMTDAIRITNEHKEGTDRNIASQQLFGRGIEAGSRLLLLNAETVKTNREAVEELNLEVGESAVAAYADYDNASDRASLTVKAFGKAIAESVLPFVTELTEWFNKIAPAAITVLRGALGGLTTMFLGVTNGVRVLWETMKAMVLTIAEPLRALFATISLGMSGKFTEAAAELKSIPGSVSSAWETAFANIAASSEKTRERIGSVWAFATGGNKAAGDSGAVKGGRGATDTRQVSGSTTAAELALQRAMQEAALKLELEYLRELLDMDEDAFKRGLISTQEFYDRKLAIEQRALQASIDAKRKEQEAAADAVKQAQQRAAGADVKDRAKAESEVLKFQAVEVKLAGEIAVLEMQRADAVRRIGNAYDEVNRKLETDLSGIRAARAKQAAEAEIDAESAALDQLKSLRQISAEQAFIVERQIAERRHAAAVSDIERRRGLIQGNQDEQRRQQEQLDAELEQRKQEHEQRLTNIEYAAIRERQQYSIDAQQSVQSGFSTMLTELMEGQKRVGDVLRNFALTIARTFENLIAQRFAERLFGAGSAGASLIDALTKPILDAISSILVSWGIAEATQTGISQTQSAARVATKTAEVATMTSLEVGGLMTVLAAQKVATISSVLGWASAAAVAAMASVAAIPFVGWAMAPGVGAATYGMGLSYLATAEQGWGRVPYDGALTELHKDEMVLPASLAEGVRRMTQMTQAQPSLAAMQSQAGPTFGDLHVQVNVPPGTELDPRAVTKALDQAIRNHWRPKF